MAVSDKHFTVNHILLRRSSCNGIAIDCNFAQVEQFICHAIPEFTDNHELVRSIGSQIRGMAHRVKLDGVMECQEDLFNAIAVLEEFLCVCPTLPAQITFEVHTYIGQIKAATKDTSGALLSYTKALWIASCSEDIPAEQTAAALHRMGLVYMMGRHYLEARNVLEKALETYKAAGGSSEPCVSGARRLHEEATKKWKESPESWSSLRRSAGTRLSQILE